MGYLKEEQITEEKAKKFIEGLLTLQENPSDDGFVFPCPRCGQERMNPKATRNSLSRHARVYICNMCGMHEALIDATRKPPLPFSEWGMAMSFAEDSDESDD